MKIPLNKLLDEINFIKTLQGLIGYAVVFITIAVIQKDRSIKTPIKKIPNNIKTNKLKPTNKWKEIKTPRLNWNNDSILQKIRTYNSLPYLIFKYKT